MKKEWIDVPIMAVKCKLWNIEVDPAINIDDFLIQFEKMYNRNVIATVKVIMNLLAIFHKIYLHSLTDFEY